nr:venom polypeptide precursor [Doratifera vulnerans]
MWFKQSFSLVFVLINCAYVRPDLPLKKCKIYDSQCILESTQRLLPIFAAGIPKYKVKATDPLWIGSFDSHKQDLNIAVQNSTLTGVKTCQIKKMEMTSTHLEGQMECDITADGQYEMKGRLLMMPLQAAGHVKVVMRQVLFNMEASIAVVTGKDGEKHWKLKKINYNYDIQGKASLNLSNLFSGNPMLNQVLNDMLKDTPKDMITEMGNPVVARVAKTIVVNINNFFRKKPIKDLVLP